MALHYGSVYIEEAIKSVIEAVDEFHILYAAKPSHGTRQNGLRLPMSESRYELYIQAYHAAGEKLKWHDGNWTVEGNQRDTIFSHAKHADIILVVDYDEIWAEGAAAQAVEHAASNPQREFRLPMIHYWRSFRRAIMHAPAYPIRVFNVHGNGAEYIHTRPINHMGYAIPTWLMAYKLAIHGHRSEFRQDVDWMSDRWAVNAQKDCHPVGSEYWNPETINPTDYLPAYMQRHLYWNMEVIEG
jgi:hypothetical protein